MAKTIEYKRSKFSATRTVWNEECSCGAAYRVNVGARGAMSKTHWADIVGNKWACTCGAVHTI